jgi:hypothetical protein
MVSNSFFFKLFFTQEWTPHILRFDFWYTVIIPATPQETVEEAGIEPGTAALQSGSPSRALANWATTSPNCVNVQNGFNYRSFWVPSC